MVAEVEMETSKTDSKDASIVVLEQQSTHH